MTVPIRVVTTVDEVLAAAALFDSPPTVEGAASFLHMPGHYLLVADVDGAPAGFVTAVEMRHPDKGLELFAYELGVDEAHRRRGIATVLLSALTDLAGELGAYGCWTLTEPDNAAALATYARLAGRRENSVVFSWATPTRERRP